MHKRTILVLEGQKTLKEFVKYLSDSFDVIHLTIRQKYDRLLIEANAVVVNIGSMTPEDIDGIVAEAGGVGALIFVGENHKLPTYDAELFRQIVNNSLLYTDLRGGSREWETIRDTIFTIGV